MMRGGQGDYTTLYIDFGLICQCEKDKWGRFPTVVWVREAARKSIIK